MTQTWERLAELSDGMYTAEDFERAAYRLTVEQVIHGQDRGSGHAYHLVSTHLRTFQEVLGRLGLTIKHNAHHSYVVASARHRVGPRMRLAETRMALVLLRLYDQASNRAEVEQGDARVDLEDLAQAYQDAIGKPLPELGELRALMLALKRYGICRLEDTGDDLQPHVVVVRASITDVLGENALHQLAGHAPSGQDGDEEAADEAA
jgi:hypothetical protein